MKKLITDRDVLDGAVSGRIVLDGNTLITPSARDRAMAQGIRIVEAGAAESAPSACARCGGAACSCAGGGLSLATCGQNAATLDALADGLYLVRVSGGQVVSKLPVTGPGLLQRAATRS